MEQYQINYMKGCYSNDKVAKVVHGNSINIVRIILVLHIPSLWMSTKTVFAY